MSGRDCFSTVRTTWIGKTVVTSVASAFLLAPGTVWASATDPSPRICLRAEAPCTARPAERALAFLVETMATTPAARFVVFHELRYGPRDHLELGMSIGSGTSGSGDLAVGIGTTFGPAALALEGVAPLTEPEEGLGAESPILALSLSGGGVSRAGLDLSGEAVLEMPLGEPGELAVVGALERALSIGSATIAIEIEHRRPFEIGSGEWDVLPWVSADGPSGTGGSLATGVRIPVDGDERRPVLLLVVEHAWSGGRALGAR